MRMSGWGRYPVLEAKVVAPRSLDALREVVRATPSLIARGNGRAYGDSAINPAATVQMRHLDRMLAFDPGKGQLIAESGVVLGDIISAFLPKGWFPRVTPGSKRVTLGGCIAADVHGKNHHKEGSFRTCVDWVEIMDGQGAITRCGPTENADLFDHTLGGMGLTGVITRAAIRLRPVETAWIQQTLHPAPDLRAAMDVFEAQGAATYSVAWIDCLARGGNLGRSLVMLGAHAGAEDLPGGRRVAPLLIAPKSRRHLRFDLPSFVLNGTSLRVFNALYYRIKSRQSAPHLVDWDSYFYPLDAIENWNRIYGRKGLVQFQCVLPLAASEAGLTALLQAISTAGQGACLAVLKRFGAQQSAFSFPMEGYTLALDFPVRPHTLALLETLDQITLAHGGRFYLAKDSRMSPATFAASDPRAAGFCATRESQGWQNRFASAQSKRLNL